MGKHKLLVNTDWVEGLLVVAAIGVWNSIVLLAATFLISIFLEAAGITMDAGPILALVVAIHLILRRSK